MSDTKDDPPPYPGPTDQPSNNFNTQYSPQYAPQGQGPPYPMGQPGYPAPGPQAQPYGQPYGGGMTVITNQQPMAGNTVIVRAGNCPNCHAGVLMDQFTCCGILCAIFFFPLGLLCCLLMRRQVCSNCGAGF